jgi:succinate-semialdehyde dehydrogenase/glutarate-semialdehyde dehydrogenase
LPVLGERRLVGDFCNTIGPGADIQRVRADLSPLSSEQALIDLLKQVDGAISHGAKVIMSGKRIDPTILTDIKPNNPAFREEFFGPVALFFRVKDEDHAIALANDSDFGLGGSGNRLASSDRVAALDACIVPKS